MRVLIIDDALEVEVLAHVLKARYPGELFELADSLAAASEKLWSERYDVVSVDIMMRADDDAVLGSSDHAGLIAGLQLIDEMRLDEECPNKGTPIVLLSGLVAGEQPRIRQAQIEYGEFFIPKPVHPDVFYQILLKAADYE